MFFFKKKWNAKFSTIVKLTCKTDGKIISLTSCLPAIPSSVTGTAILTFLEKVEYAIDDLLDVVLAALKGLGALTVSNPLINYIISYMWWILRLVWTYWIWWNIIIIKKFFFAGIHYNL